LIGRSESMMCFVRCPCKKHDITNLWCLWRAVVGCMRITYGLLRVEMFFGSTRAWAHAARVVIVEPSYAHHVT